MVKKKNKGDILVTVEETENENKETEESKLTGMASDRNSKLP